MKEIINQASKTRLTSWPRLDPDDCFFQGVCLGKGTGLVAFQDLHF